MMRWLVLAALFAACGDGGSDENDQAPDAGVQVSGIEWRTEATADGYVTTFVAPGASTARVTWSGTRLGANLDLQGQAVGAISFQPSALSRSSSEPSMRCTSVVAAPSCWGLRKSFIVRLHSAG